MIVHQIACKKKFLSGGCHICRKVPKLGLGDYVLGLWLKCKTVFHLDFGSLSEYDKIFHADSSHVKKCPCVFFATCMEKSLDTHAWMPPLPFSPNKWGGGGGWEELSCLFVKIFLPAWRNRNYRPGHQSSRHVKFQGILTNLTNFQTQDETLTFLMRGLHLFT